MWRHRQMVFELIRRDIVGRYKGAFLGSAWSLLNPLLMLAVYSFVFGGIFRSRWRSSDAGFLDFAVPMFAGMILFNIFSEVATRAPTLVQNHANFVKKVVFPLDTLTVMTAGTALFHYFLALIVLLLGTFALHGFIPLTVFLVPVVITPYLLFVLGIGWFLASLGVFVRDLAQFVNIAVSVLMFLAPIFFPISAVPTTLQPLIHLNPITIPVEAIRSICVLGELPDWFALAEYSVIAAVVAYLGHQWFERTRKGFADVL